MEFQETIFRNETIKSRIETLDCFIQTYAWGKYGSESLAGILKK